MKKTKFSKMAALLLAAALIVTLVPVNADAAIKRKVTLYVSQGKTLKAVKGAKWKSSNKSVAAVSKKGKVTAKKAGKATVTAKKGKRTWKFAVTVKNPYLTKKQVSMAEGQIMPVSLIGATVKSCVSSNARVATVTRQTKKTVQIRAIEAGEASVSVKASNGQVYVCAVNISAKTQDNRRNTATQPPKAAACKAWEHEWVKVDGPVEYGSNDAGDHWQKVCYKCSVCGETKYEKENPERCTLVECVLKEPTCTEDGEKERKCTVCGSIVYYPRGFLKPDLETPVQDYLIPRTGHDFEYTYKKQVTVRDDWDLNYDYNNEHGWEGMGERTATCKTCGESFEEVGFDTGVELADGSQAVVWGVWEKDATKILTDEINNYRKAGADEEGGTEPDLMTPTDELNSYALFKAAQLRARSLKNCVGQQGKGWATMSGYVMTAPLDEKIELLKEFQQYRDVFAHSNLKYSGAAHLRYETEDGGFADTVVVVADKDDHPRITCKKFGHDIDYASICHRCGRNSGLTDDDWHQEYWTDPYLPGFSAYS